ncbi:hypothetical protein [Paenibacillus naphthalenovorans]|uniref:hypothetical protein n=1 Tax=Paenibacillus naphthalenovorans TaxID=162209 RepID=UPI003D2BEE8E
MVVNYILSSGLWIGVLVSGYLIFLRLFLMTEETKQHWMVIFGLSVSTGIVVWSIPLLGSALLGIYNGKAFGIAGYVSSCILLIKYKKYIPSISKLKLNISTIVLILGLMVVAVIVIGFPNESLMGGRDEGVYANSAIYIANHGDIHPQYPEGFKTLPFNGTFLPGFYSTPGEITVQFSQLLPVWLAHAYNSFGLSGLLGLNGVLCIISLLVFFGILERNVSRNLAVLGTFILGLSASQIWLSRVTLTEIFTQLMLLSGLYIFEISYKNNVPRAAIFAGILFGFTCFIRIDSFMYIPLILLAHSCFRILEKEKKNNEIWLNLYLSLFLVSTFALIYYYLFSNPYFTDLLPQLKLIGYLIVGALLVHVIIKYIKPIFKFRKTIFYSLVILLVLMFSYAHLIRPNIQPFILYSGTGTVLDGTRTFREDSLVNLGAYLSIPIIYLFLFGVIKTIYDYLISKSSINRINLLSFIVIVGATSVYLYDPSISPDHFWAVRRFVPIIIPGVIILAIYGLDYIFKSIRHRLMRNIIFLITVLYFFNFTITNDRLIVNHRESAGYWNQIINLEKKIPDEAILVDYMQWATTTPLYAAFDKQILPVRFLEEKALVNKIHDLLISGKQVYVLTDRYHPIKILGTNAFAEEYIDLSYNIAEKVAIPLPKKIIELRFPLVLHQLNLKEEDTISFGGTTVLGIKETGMLPQEHQPNGTPFRWTNGNAKYVVPISSKPSRLKLEILNASPKGTDLEVLIGGQTVHAGHFETSTKTFDIDISHIDLGKDLSIEIRSTTWKPSEILKNNDSRILGVAIKNITIY